MKKLKIYLDVDDVVADWVTTFCKKYNCPLPNSWFDKNITVNRLNELKKNKSFWVNLPIKHRPNFKPNGFLSARSIPKKWTFEFMKLNGISGRTNIHHVPWNVSKINKLKQLQVDIFIDDKFETFKECHDNNIFCLLMDACHNKNIITPYKIYKLDIDEILNKYNKWKQETR